jgi:Kef-type K+ transport system membrane component KefB
MHSNVFTEISVIIAIGAAISLVMRLVKQPLIIGYIITGLLVGPSFLNLIKNSDTIDVFASIGVALLLFIVGLGLNPRVIKEIGKVAGITAFAQITITSLLGYVFGQFVGFSKTESLLLGLALSFSSTIIVLKLLSDKKELTRLNGKIAVGILLIEDIVATLSLIFISARADGSFSVNALLFLAVKGILLLAILIVISNFVLQKMNNFIASNQELLFLFAIGWGFGVASIFLQIGFSIEIGALFAGISLSALPYAQEVSSRLRPLRDFFIILFFISLGSGLSLASASENILLAIILSVLVLIGKPFVFMLVMGLNGYTKSTSFKVSNYLSQISEFSLIILILGFQNGLVRESIISLVTMVALITIAVSTYTITYNNQIYAFLEKRLSLFERRITKKDEKRAVNYDMILFGYKKGGQEFIRTMKSINKKFIVVDYDPDVIDTLERQNIPYAYGDVSDPELLEELNLGHAKSIVSTITDFNTNDFLAKWVDKINPSAVFICTADSAQEASDLYQSGADYVMLPPFCW